MNILKNLLDIAKKIEKPEKKAGMLSPNILTRKICNGGTSCVAFKDYKAQQTCFFFEKAQLTKQCLWVRKEIEHCSNPKAQSFKK